MNKRIKKIIIALILCAGLFSTLAPKIFGIGVQEVFNADLLKQIAKQTNNKLKVTVSQVNSSWFQTFISLNIEYIAPNTNKVISAIAELNVNHGPFILNADQLKFGLASAKIRMITDDEKLAEILDHIKLELPTLTSTVFISLNQRLKITVEVPPLSAANNSYGIVSQGLIGEILFEKDRSVDANISIRQLNIQDLLSNTELSISKSDIAFTSKGLSRTEAPSEFSLAIPYTTIMGIENFSVSDVFLNLKLQTSSVDYKSINISQNLSLRDIQSEFPITSLSSASEINGVRHEIFTKYYQILFSLGSRAAAEASELREEIGLLVAQSKLELKNLIKANIYDGEHTLDLKLEWEGLPYLTRLEDLKTNELMQSLVAQVDISLEKNSVENSGFTSEISQYIEQGYIIDDDPRLNLNGKIQDGALHLNDTTTRLEEFFE